MNNKWVGMVGLTASMILLSGTVQAKDHNKMIAGIDLGYALGQTFEIKSNSGTDKYTGGSGFAYGAYFGYYFAEPHRMKLGFLMFSTKPEMDDAGDKFKAKVDNTLIHVDYDYIIPLNNQWNFYVGANIGYMMTELKEIEGEKPEGDGFKPSGFALGAQFGAEWTHDHLLVGADFRYIYNMGKDDATPGGDKIETKSPQVMLINFNVGYRF